MIGEIVAEAERGRHAGGMPPSVKQATVAASERSFTGAYLRETLKKAPRAPAQAGAQKPSRPKRKRSSALGAEDQPDLIAAK